MNPLLKEKQDRENAEPGELEFDEAAARGMWINSPLTSSTKDSFIAGARWQFTKDRERLARAEAENYKLASRCNDFNEEVNKLTRELAEKDALLAEFMTHTAWAASLPEGWPNLELRKTRAKLRAELEELKGRDEAELV